MATNSQLLAEAHKKYPEYTEYYNIDSGELTTSNGSFIWEGNQIVEEDHENDVVYDSNKGWAKNGDDLLNEAKNRYPLGAVLIDIFTDSIFEVVSFNDFECDHCGINIDGNQIYDYEDQKWAEIDKELTRILAIVKKIFVFGTKFICLEDGSEYTIDDNGIYINPDGEIMYSSEVLYRYGTYATVIPSPSNHESSNANTFTSLEDNDCVTLPIKNKSKRLTVINIE